MKMLPIAAAVSGCLCFPASAQELAIKDLQGLTVAATVKYRGMFARERGSGPGNITHNYRIVLGPDENVQVTQTRNVEAITPVGPKHSSLKRTFSGKVGTPGQSSAGSFLWLLEKNELVLLRTLEVGGFKLTLAFTKTDKGMTCTANGPYLKEAGAGAGKTESAAGGKVRIISMQQVGSSCSVSKS
jgi:hypothetical protein